jgi:hypothetical protein
MLKVKTFLFWDWVGVQGIDTSGVTESVRLFTTIEEVHEYLKTNYAKPLLVEEGLLINK